MTRFGAVALGLSLLLVPAAHAQAPMHAIAMHGSPKYPDGFSRFDYVNPDAPKGGVLRMTPVGTFDTLNPYSL